MLLATLALALAGCPPPPAPRPPALVPPADRAIAVWPPILVQDLPGEVVVPWATSPGAPLELWRINLLDVDRPELTAWLEAWRPQPPGPPRPVGAGGAGTGPGRLAVARPGAYLVRSMAAGQTRVGLVLTSPVRAALTLDDSHAEVFCTDARTGEPVRGAFVKVVYRTERLGRDRVLSASGTTDAMGRWHTSLVRDRFAHSVVAAAIVALDSQYGVATARRTLDPVEADHRLVLRPRALTVAPGETADMAGWLRRRSGGRWVPAPNVALKLWLVDPRGTAIDSTTVRTDAVGGFEGSFPIAKEAATGSYSVVAVADGETRFEPRRVEALSVAAKSPTPVHLTLSLGRSILAPGDTLELALAAQSAGGKPLSGATVHFLSWGYPVSAQGRAPWLARPADLDERQVEALPLGLPEEVKTDGDGRIALRWQPTRAELSPQDLLCAVHARVDAPGLGQAERTAEVILLGEPPALAIEAQAPFCSPSEPIELTFTSSLPPDQAKTPATCSLAFEDSAGQRRNYEVLRTAVGVLVQRRLRVTASQPGRYTFTARAGRSASETCVWVVADDGDVPWTGSEAPTLIAERAWVRRGEPLRAVVAGRPGPLALTVRSDPKIERRTLLLRTGARSVRLRAEPGSTGPLEATLVQFHDGIARVGRAEIEAEPDGQALDVLTRLLWVRQAERSGRGYSVVTQDRLGGRVQSVVRFALVRPSFQGVPPAAIRRKTLERESGKATSPLGEIEVSVEDSRLPNAYALLVEALAPDGRAGAAVEPACAARPVPDLNAGAKEPRSPREKLALLARLGIATAAERWLAACLLTQNPDLAVELPKLIASAKSDEGAVALLGLAAGYPSVAVPALDAALARGGAIRAPALAIAAEFAKDARPALQQVLATDPAPAPRVASARALGRALPASLPGLAQALASDPDPAVRAAAASALASGDAQAMATLAAAAAREPNADVQRAIVAALRQLGGPVAATALLDLAAGRGPEVAVAALRALADVGYRGADRRLLRILRSGPPAAQAEAAAILARSNEPEAAQALLAAAARPTGPIVQALAGARRTGTPAALQEWLNHEDPAVRLAAAEHLATVKDDRARPVLRSFLEATTPPEMADRAARALIAWRDDGAAAKLVALLEAGRLTPETRLDLLRTAGKLGWQPAGRSLLLILGRGLAEPGRLRLAEERQLWTEAAGAASIIGPIFSGVAPSAFGPAPPDPLYASALDALRSADLPAFFRGLWRLPLPEELRREAVLGYARLRGAAAAPELIDLLDSPVLQGAATEALAKAGAVEPLLAALRNASPRTRAGAAAALGAIGEPRAVPALQPLLLDADPFVRQEAAWALAALTRQPVAYRDPLGELRQATP